MTNSTGCRHNTLFCSPFVVLHRSWPKILFPLGVFPSPRSPRLSQDLIRSFPFPGPRCNRSRYIQENAPLFSFRHRAFSRRSWRRSFPRSESSSSPFSSARILAFFVAARVATSLFSKAGKYPKASPRALFFPHNSQRRPFFSPLLPALKSMDPPS